MCRAGRGAGCKHGPSRCAQRRLARAHRWRSWSRRRKQAVRLLCMPRSRRSPPGRSATAVVVGVSVASIVAPGASALGRVYGQPWGEGPATRVAEDGGLLPPPRTADATAGLLGIDRAQQDLAATRSLERRRAAADDGFGSDRSPSWEPSRSGSRNVCQQATNSAG